MDFAPTQAEKDWFGKLARLAIECILANKPETAIPEVPAELEAGLARQLLGSFVTILQNGNLRGCIGTIIGHEPLYQNIWRMAQAAAFQDYRFPQMNLNDWANCHLHISLMSPLSLCQNTADIVIGKHGLVLQQAGRSGVFLPEVPVEQGWDLPAYLSNLCRKANLPDKAWLEADAKLFSFYTEAFDC